MNLSAWSNSDQRLKSFFLSTGWSASRLKAIASRFFFEEFVSTLRLTPPPSTEPREDRLKTRSQSLPRDELKG